ncbi:MAG: hypothetical protein KDK78_04035, partial [Chlamydiia bacterium]|nr:hypothetical protein [Chlamydiia bacterium]
EAKDKFGLAVVLLRAYSGLSEEELSSEVVDEGKSPNYDKKMKAYRKIFQICEGKKEMPQDVTEAILDGLAAAQTLDVTYEHWQENERKYK